MIQFDYHWFEIKFDFFLQVRSSAVTQLAALSAAEITGKCHYSLHLRTLNKPGQGWYPMVCVAVASCLITQWKD